MPNYQYTGVNALGKPVKGTAQGTSTHQLYKQLRDQGIYVYTATEVTEKKASLYRLNAKELANFSRQLGTLQHTGIPVIKAMTMMLDQEIKPREKRVYEHILSIISQGHALSYAMEQCEGSFPQLLINMYRSGEASGNLDATAMKMATYYDSEHKLNLKIKNAMAYPTILAVLTVVITLGMFTIILPNFFDMFTASGLELNILTRSVLGISEFLVDEWALLLCIVVFFALLGRFAISRPSVRLQLDQGVLITPKIGLLSRTICTARFARTLSSLYSSGVSMLDAVEIASTTIGNRYIESQFPKALDSIRSGQALSTAMSAVDGIERKLLATIYIGEETGRLDHMLLAVSDEYEYESDMAIERMLTYIEPVMIIIMALIVGIVMVAVMVPVMNMRYTIV